MKIDPGSHVPIYLQIAEGVRAAVAAGVYRPGEALPSLRAMAIELQVNPNTVQRAYDELEREGLIYSQRGRGLFVAERGTASAQSRTRDGVRRAFDEAVRAGQAAGMTRPTTARDLRGSRSTACARPGPANIMSTNVSEQPGHRTGRPDETVRPHAGGRQSLAAAFRAAARSACSGPNGAGKSTTIKMLMGMLSITAGEARVLGIDVRRDPVQVKQRSATCPRRTTSTAGCASARPSASAGRCIRSWNDQTCREMLELFRLDPRKKVQAPLEGDAA